MVVRFHLGIPAIDLQAVQGEPQEAGAAPKGSVGTSLGSTPPIPGPNPFRGCARSRRRPLAVV